MKGSGSAALPRQPELQTGERLPLDIRQSDKQGALDQRPFFFAFARLQKPIAASAKICPKIA